ncbi:2-hydroxyacid dehydrogenase [Algoriphagus zhangzhouensis]|uniref:D-lactate dehydrogenase n=1 Tax=Algoriphagus zhangzhouensis TaxID=1073327 RepID=A0A1M7ZE28_9BACT|nr:2-hydroxyacid dehydrogenase [Algoriphagus zhangzhouensis]TDY45976.1 D-lactate dehydrogenase [Algoriphagus zhangzhouensis]SHO63181.1 D-lactate dehydrogenase [Algoriphagus zhangzhouensis]
MRIAFYSAKSYDRDSFNLYESQFGHQITYFEAKLDKHSTSLAEEHEVVCAFVNDILDKQVLKKLKSRGVKLIALRCAGYNQVDLDAAKEFDLPVVRVPVYSPEAVAEHAFALLLTLSRKTHKAYNRVRESNFSLEGLTGFNLHGKTFGVVGTGAIGRAFCKIALGFGGKVLAYDLFENEEMNSLGIQYHGIKELFSKSDIISLHCPLTPETKHLINGEAIQHMKDGVALVNTSRGALIETKSVIKALKNRKIGYLGIDVYEQEEDLFFKNLSEQIIPDEQISRLMTFPNVLITGHQAFLTKEALGQIALTTLNNISEFEDGKNLTNQIG